MAILEGCHGALSLASPRWGTVLHRAELDLVSRNGAAEDRVAVAVISKRFENGVTTQEARLTVEVGNDLRCIATLVGAMPGSAPTVVWEQSRADLSNIEAVSTAVGDLSAALAGIIRAQA
jgi:hypothetical protein